MHDWIHCLSVAQSVGRLAWEAEWEAVGSWFKNSVGILVFSGPQHLFEVHPGARMIYLPHHARPPWREVGGGHAHHALILPYKKFKFHLNTLKFIWTKVQVLNVFKDYL